MRVAVVCLCAVVVYLCFYVVVHRVPEYNSCAFMCAVCAFVNVLIHLLLLYASF